MSTANHPEPKQSRLDREVDEILERASTRPISFQDRVAQKRTAMQVQKRSQVNRARAISSGPVRTVGQWAMRLPLVTALVFAIVAVYIAGDWPVIATLLGLVAAAFIFVPFVVKRPTDDITYQKRWRGRPMSPPRSGGFRSAIDSARDRFQR